MQRRRLRKSLGTKDMPRFTDMMCPLRSCQRCRCVDGAGWRLVREGLKKRAVSRRFKLCSLSDAGVSHHHLILVDTHPKSCTVDTVFGTCLWTRS